MYNNRRNQKGGEKMEDKIWEVFLVLLSVLFTTIVDIVREHRKNKPRR